jgi:hypothetical protein
MIGSGSARIGGVSARATPRWLRPLASWLVVLSVAGFAVGVYQTTVPADPMTQIDGAFGGWIIPVQTGQRVAVVGWAAAAGPGGVVFDSPRLPRYPGLTLRLMTTSSLPLGGGVELLASPKVAVMPHDTLEPIAGRGLRRPRHGAEGHISDWWLPLVLVIRADRPGCWDLENLPVSYHIGGTTFRHETGGLRVRTPGAHCS